MNLSVGCAHRDVAIAHGRADACLIDWPARPLAQQHGVLVRLQCRYIIQLSQSLHHAFRGGVLTATRGYAVPNGALVALRLVTVVFVAHQRPSSWCEVHCGVVREGHLRSREQRLGLKPYSGEGQKARARLPPAHHARGHDNAITWHAPCAVAAPHTPLFSTSRTGQRIHSGGFITVDLFAHIPYSVMSDQRNIAMYLCKEPIVVAQGIHVCPDAVMGDRARLTWHRASPYNHLAPSQ